MASLLSPHRSGRPSGRQDADVRLTATTPTETEQPDAEQPTGPRYGWQLAAVGGALTAALAGWIIVTGLTVVGWLAAALAGASGDMADAVRIGTRLWLLANGAPADLGSVHWTLVPLGVSLLTVFMVSRFARAAARFAVPDPTQGLAEAGLGRIFFGIVGLTTVGYAAVVAAVGLGTGAQISRGIVGAALIAAAGSAWGASRALDLRLADVLPDWARPVPVAVAAAVGVLLLSGGVVLAAGILTHTDRIGTLAGGLGAGVIGGIALWAAQAAFLPNLIGWGASYALGAGFRLGQGTVIAPSDVTLGLMPSIPILGALPAPGPGADLGLLWLVSGVLAGGLAAWLVVRRRPDARFDETALVGGLAGVLAALLFTGSSWFTSGDLGAGRLSGAGPRMLELLVMSGTLLGLSGVLCGLILGLVRYARERSAERSSELADTPSADVDPADGRSVDVDPVDALSVEGGADDETARVAGAEADQPIAPEDTPSEEDTDDATGEGSTAVIAETAAVDEADEPTHRVQDRRSA